MGAPPYADHVLSRALSGRVRVASRNSRQDQPLTINSRLDGLGKYTVAQLSPLHDEAMIGGASDRMVRVLES
jgi:hypothetical protein